MVTTPKALQKSFPFEASVISDSLGTFSGYASTWSVDDKGDQMASGAFSKSLAKAEAYRVAKDRTFLFAVTWYHFSEEPLGGIYEAYEDSRGLYVKGLIDLTTKVGKRAFSGLKKGYIDGLSIQGFVNKCSFKGTVRQIDECELVAIGVGCFPVDREARVTDAKSARDAWLEGMVNDMTLAAKRHGSQKRIIGMDDFNEAAFGGHTDSAFGAASGTHCLIEPGKHPEESREEFEKEIRAQLRSEDDIYVLHGKAFDREVERRRLARDEKRRLQSEALEADRKAIADRRIEPLEEYTLEQLAAKVGVDLVWLTRLVKTCIEREEITPAISNTMILRGCDFMRLGRKYSEQFELQAQRYTYKQAERAEQQKRSA